MNTAAPAHRLRWYQYSLRSLFVLTVLVAIAGSWFAVKRQQKERERAAVHWIIEMGGSAYYDYEFGFAATGEPTGPAWLRSWLGDDFFAHVVAVNLGKTQVTDSSLHQLEPLTELQILWVSDTNLTDAGLKHLERMTRLELLLLDGTKVTDAGLDHLQGLRQLKSLTLSGTRVTEDGVTRLQQALPNCEISADFPPPRPE